MTRDAFVEFCTEITGYSAYDLEGTGLVDTYLELLERVLGAKLFQQLGLLLADAMSQPAGSPERKAAFRQAWMAPSVFEPVVSNLIQLWYLGTWFRLPDTWYVAVGLPLPGPMDAGNTHTPSIDAYINQLSYRSAFVNAPGSNPPGFASWSYPPAEVAGGSDAALNSTGGDFESLRSPGKEPAANPVGNPSPSQIAATGLN